MTNYREQYKCLLIEYERLGGNLQGVPRFYSLENEAKLRREMNKLANKPISQLENELNPETDKLANSPCGSHLLPNLTTFFTKKVILERF